MTSTLLADTWVAVVPHSYDRTVQTNAHGRGSAIQPAVVGLGQHHVFHGVSRNCFGDEGPHQQAGNGGIAIRKMKDVRIGLVGPTIAGGSQHGIEARITIAIVIAFIVERESGDGVDAHPVEIVAAGLENGDHLGSALGNLGQKIGVADFVQDGLLLFRGKAGQVVHLFGVEADDVAARRVGERGLGEKIPVRNLAEACHQTIFSEGLAVEEHAASQLQRGSEIPVVVVVELLHVNAHVGQQTLGLGAVKRGAFNRLGAVTEQQPVSRVELFPSGVPAEVVVRFENQDARIGAGLLAEEVRRRQSGDTRTHHDEIVGAIGGGGGTGVLPKSSVAQTVRGFERTGVIATHPGARRRVVTGAILRCIGIGI